jgi:hypothetical protein
MKTLKRTGANEMQTILAQMIEARTEHQAMLDRLQNCLLGQGFVVISGGMALKFDIAADRTATNPNTTPVTMAPRFTRRDAEMLAAAVTNGKGEHGKAVHVRDALAEQIKNQTMVIEMIEKRQAE